MINDTSSPITASEGRSFVLSLCSIAMIDLCIHRESSRANAQARVRVDTLILFPFISNTFPWNNYLFRYFTAPITLVESKLPYESISSFLLFSDIVPVHPKWVGSISIPLHQAQLSLGYNYWDTDASVEMLHWQKQLWCEPSSFPLTFGPILAQYPWFVFPFNSSNLRYVRILVIG